MKSIKKISISLMLFFVMNVTGMAAEKQELPLLSEWQCWKSAPAFLLQHLNAKAEALLNERIRQIAPLQTAEDWQQRQKQVKQRLNDILGPFPDKTPLNASVVGVIQKDGYRIEKIIFESMPQLYVTGCLFIPDQRQDKTPAIVYLSGHSDNAYKYPNYVHVIMNLVKKGFIVFAYDPPSQGERVQYYDNDLKRSLVGWSTKEHSHFGRQCFLNGVSCARYFVWDGIRAIDYLLTRSEVDANRIATTGNSGGGTQTAYLSAIDERVLVSVPSCYITSYHRLLESIGPQDAEQVFYRGLAEGLDHADLIEVRAPKPTLLLCTTRDFFSIQGSRETYVESKKVFTALNASQNLQMAEDDSVHGYTPKNREALYAFLQKHLSMPGSSADEDIVCPATDEITVTSTGQISSSTETKRIFDYNKIETEKNITLLQKQREADNPDFAAMKQKAMQIAGYQTPLKSYESVFIGGCKREGYRIEKYVINSPASPCIIPLLLFIPSGSGSFTPVLILHPEGKNKDLTESGFVEQLIKNKCIVASIDLSGLGEVGTTVDGIQAPFTGVLTGRSIVGLHAEEIIRAVDFIRSRPDISKDKLSVIAYSDLCPALIHAAAFEPSLSRIALVKPLVSYESIATNLLYKTPGWIEVAGALKAYDLIDLTASIAPRPLLFLSPIESSLNPLNEDGIQKNYDFTKKIYKKLGEAKNLSIYSEAIDESGIQSKILDWINN